MALPVTIPNTFANATTSIPLSQLDTNFSTLANAVNGINSGSEILANLKSSNVTITGGVISNVTLDNVTVDVETLSNVTINGGNVTVTNMVATTANATTGNITTVIVGAGTSAAPSITFTGDTNTGIFSPAADTIAFTEGGAEAMRIDSSGNVGVGTTSPTGYRLNAVAAFASGVGGAYIEAGEFNQPVMVLNHTNGSVSANLFQVQKSGTGVLTLDSSGNVGLGVTPSAWDVTGSGGPVLQIKRGLFFGADSETRLIHNAYYGTGDFRYIATGVAATNYQQASGQHRWFNAASGTAGNTITFTQAMTLDASGNLGIGETSPSTPLSSARGLVLKGSSDTQIRIQNTNTGSTSSDGFLLSIDNSASPLAYVWNYENAALIFGTNNTERARITSAGTVGINTTSPDAATVLTIKARSGENGMAVKAGTNGNYGIYFNNTSDSTVGGIIINASTTTYATSSDYRLKENVAPMTGALAKVLELNPVTYTWKADDSAGEGFIAHELQEVAPYAVTGEKDGEKMQGVDYGKLTPILTAALQEAIAEIQSLKARIAVLEAK
jgi:hypothetical protein